MAKRSLQTPDGGCESDKTSASVASLDVRTTARSLQQASRAPEYVQCLDLSSTGAFVCKNMFCENVGQSCVCRLSLWISQMSPRLTALTTLSLANNGLEQVPESVGELNNIKWLDLSHNDIRELPASMTRLQRLEKLDIRGNLRLRDSTITGLKTHFPGINVISS